jgi:hypothetical protein
MGRIRFIFNTIIHWLWRGRQSRPEDIPKKLDIATLEKVMQEARFLHSHQVDVQSLAKGEVPLPRRADTN